MNVLPVCDNNSSARTQICTCVVATGNDDHAGGSCAKRKTEVCQQYSGKIRVTMFKYNIYFDIH